MKNYATMNLSIILVTRFYFSFQIVKFIFIIF